MKKKTAAIINDHLLLSDLMAEALRKSGFAAPRAFTNLEDGVRFILARAPDLAILNMMMPTSRTRNGDNGDHHHPYILMDIQGTLKAVRQIKDTCQQTRVLILNGERHPNAYLSGFEAGADGIASKLDGYARRLIFGTLLAPF